MLRFMEYPAFAGGSREGERETRPASSSSSPIETLPSSIETSSTSVSMSPIAAQAPDWWFAVFPRCLCCLCNKLRYRYRYRSVSVSADLYLYLYLYRHSDQRMKECKRKNTVF